MALLQLENITKTYKIGDKETLVLSELNLQINNGDYISLMGPSGSGKSTLMNIIGCLDTLTNGKYYFEGDDISNKTGDELASLRNKKIGFVFQQFHLLPRLSALENVCLPMQYAGIPKNERLERGTAMLEKLGLLNRLNHKPNQLSGGQMQRIAIARALINNPSLILADEPTGNLDSNTSNEIMDIFKELNDAGNTIIIVTHEEDIANKTNKIIKLKDGKIINI